MGEAAPQVQVPVKPPAGIPVPAPVAKPPEGAPPEKPQTPAAPAEDPRVQQLLAKEQALVKQQQAFKAERDAFAKEKAEAAELKALIAQAKRDPDSVAKRLWGDGYYESLTEMRLNGSKVTPDLIAAAVDEKLSSFEKRQQEQREQEAQERQKLAEQERTRIIEQWKGETRDFVKARGEEYELINMHGWHDVVIDTIERHFAQTQKIMSTKEAADYVEQYLADSVQKSLAAKRFQQKPPVPPEKPIGSAQPRTLTNAHGAVTTPPAETSLLTEEERLRRAIAAGEAARKARGG